MIKKILIILIIIYCSFRILVMYIGYSLSTYEVDQKSKNENTEFLIYDGTYQIMYTHTYNSNKAYSLVKLKDDYVHFDICKYKIINNKIYTYGLEKYAVTNINTETTIESYYLDEFEEDDKKVLENLDEFVSLCDNDFRSVKKLADNTIELLGDGTYQIGKGNTDFEIWLTKFFKYQQKLCEYKIINNKIYTIGNQTEVNMKYMVADFINHDYKDSEFIKSNNLSDFSEEDRLIFEEHKDFIKLCDLE